MTARLWTQSEWEAYMALKRTMRPPDAQGMTGHIHDGSLGGLCGEGHGGYHTLCLALVDCSQCLVMFDWAQESGVYDVVDGHVHVPGQDPNPPKPQEPSSYDDDNLGGTGEVDITDLNRDEEDEDDEGS